MKQVLEGETPVASVRVRQIVLLIGIAAMVGFAQRPAVAQPVVPPSQKANSTIKATVRIVELDVVAVDEHGQPVKGLKATDFVLSEDGVPQALQSFTERDAAADQRTPPVMPALPPNTFANHAPVVNNTAMTVLLFDTSGLNAPDAAYARDEAAAYLKKVQPGTPMCVFDLDQWDGLRLIQDLTTDSTALRKAVESKANAQKPVVPHFTPVMRRGPAIRELAAYLAGFPGRKNVIWFGGDAPAEGVGRPHSLFPDTTSYSDEQFREGLTSMTTTLTFNGVTLYSVDPRGVVFSLEDVEFPWASPEPYGSSSTSSTAFPQNSAAAVLQQGADASAAAKGSGGKAFFSSNAIDKDVAQVVAAGSHYYTVSYAPTNANWNGAFRRLAVQFAGATTSTGVPTAKLRLQYRDGYYAQATAPQPGAATPAGQARRMLSYSPKGAPGSATPSTPLDDAMRFGAVAPFEVLFQAHITPDAEVQKIKGDGKAAAGNYLTGQWVHAPYRNYGIHYSVDPEDLQFVHGKDGLYRDAIEFAAVLYDNYDHEVNSFLNTVPLAVNAADYAEIRKTGVGIELPIAVPVTGEFYLRLGVHDLNTGHLGALEIPVNEIKVAPADAVASAKGH